MAIDILTALDKERNSLLAQEVTNPNVIVTTQLHHRKQIPNPAHLNLTLRLIKVLRVILSPHLFIVNLQQEEQNFVLESTVQDQTYLYVN
jgi:hypothetical protein